MSNNVCLISIILILPLSVKIKTKIYLLEYHFTKIVNEALHEIESAIESAIKNTTE